MESLGIEAEIITIAQFVYLFFGLIYIIFSLILVYHWRSYATSARVISLTLWTYFLTTLTLLGLAGVSIFFI